MLDAGYQQDARAILAGSIDGQTQVDAATLDANVGAIMEAVGVLHVGCTLDGLHDGIGQDVREGELRHPSTRQHLIEDPAILFEGLDRDRPYGRGRGDTERGDHILGDLTADRAQRYHGVAFQQGGHPLLRGRGRGRTVGRSRRLRCRYGYVSRKGYGRRDAAFGRVGLEEFLPCRRHG